MPAPQKTSSKLDVVPVAKESIISDSGTSDYNHEQVNIYGPPGVGKTFCALSWSRHWPKEPGDGKTKPIAPKLTRLDDVLHLDFDGNGGTGLREQNLIVPTLSVPDLMRKGKARNIFQAIGSIIPTEVGNWCEKNLKAQGALAVCSDTITTLDSDLGKYWDDNCPTTKSGAKDTRMMWTCLANSHKKFHEMIRFMPAVSIFNFHAKANIETDSKEGQDQQKKNAAAGLSDISPAITGKAVNLYIGIGSTIFWMTARRGPSGRLERKLHTIPIAGVLVKNRWQRSLEAEEEPNLRKLFDKIRAASR